MALRVPSVHSILSLVSPRPHLVRRGGLLTDGQHQGTSESAPGAKHFARAAVG